MVVPSLFWLLLLFHDVEGATAAPWLATSQSPMTTSGGLVVFLMDMIGVKGAGGGGVGGCGGVLHPSARRGEHLELGVELGELHVDGSLPADGDAGELVVLGHR